MYKINVKSDGKYHNAVLGERYALSKRKAKRLIALFRYFECELEVTKLTKCGRCWEWSHDHSLYDGCWKSNF